MLFEYTGQHLCFHYMFKSNTRYLNDYKVLKNLKTISMTAALNIYSSPLIILYYYSDYLLRILYCQRFRLSRLNCNITLDSERNKNVLIL